MNLFYAFTFLGGIAFFLYGMNLMGNGLEKASGGKLERVLEKLTGNRLTAVLLGAGVTAVIQSSSATTVMVVGFVNSGIMKLNQAVGIIMGANIGTTVTSWILSLTGIQGDSFFLQLLKPTTFAPVLAFIGIICIMFLKGEKKHNLGMILIGFALLMFGMDTMSGAVEPLAEVPGFSQLLVKFSNPILGVLVGAVLTAVIQSSSASVGILQALCVTGSVSYGVAIPIIMGQNIGTCITAILSSVGANKNAKRAAAVHLYFNLIGTVVLMSIFYMIHAAVPFPFMQTSINAAEIAVVHSIFNILTTALLLPFGNQLEKLACLTVGHVRGEEDTEEEDTEEFCELDPRFLDRPALACQQCKNAVNHMASISQKALYSAIAQLSQYDKKKAEKIKRYEKQIDQYEDQLGNYMVRLSNRQLSDRDSRTVAMLLHDIGDIERIGDHANNISKAAQEMYEKELHFSEKGEEEIRIFAGAIHEIVATTFFALEKEDMAMAAKIEPLEEIIDELNAEMKRRHIKRLQKGTCTINMGFILSDITTNYERIADHCSNIAVSLLLREEELDSHEYIHDLKHGNNEQFQADYKIYKNKYLLP